MSQRPSSSLGFNRLPSRRANLYSLHHPTYPSTRHRRVFSGSSALVDLYQPIDDPDDSTPPPPYELIDPIPSTRTAITQPLLSHLGPLNPAHTPAATQSIGGPSSSSSTSPPPPQPSSSSSSSSPPSQQAEEQVPQRLPSLSSPNPAQPRSSSRPRGPRPLPTRLYSDLTDSSTARCSYATNRNSAQICSSSRELDNRPQPLTPRTPNSAPMPANKRDLNFDYLSYNCPLPPADPPRQAGRRVPGREAPIPAPSKAVSPQPPVLVPPPTAQSHHATDQIVPIAKGKEPTSKQSTSEIKINPKMHNVKTVHPNDHQPLINQDELVHHHPRRPLPNPPKTAVNPNTAQEEKDRSARSGQRPPLTNASRVKNRNLLMMKKIDLHEPNHQRNASTQSASTQSTSTNSNLENTENPPTQSEIEPESSLSPPLSRQPKRREKLVKNLKSHQNMPTFGLTQPIHSKTAGIRGSKETRSTDKETAKSKSNGHHHHAKENRFGLNLSNNHNSNHHQNLLSFNFNFIRPKQPHPSPTRNLEIDQHPVPPITTNTNQRSASPNQSNQARSYFT